MSKKIIDESPTFISPPLISSILYTEGGEFVKGSVEKDLEKEDPSEADAEAALNKNYIVGVDLG